MNTEPQLNPWKQLLRSPSRSEPKSSGPHFVDDNEILDRWEDATLSESEHTQIIAHLADCAYCRAALTRMMRENAFVLSTDAAIHGEPSDLVARRTETRKSNWFTLQRTSWIALTAVACLIALLALWPGDPDIDGQIALANRELRQGDPSTALTRIEKLAAQSIPSSARQKVAELAEDAAYQAARKSLEKEQFAEVSGFEIRAKRIGQVSPRLLNLRLQAERGINRELTLDNMAALTNYGYELDGEAYGKSAIGLVDATTERWHLELQQAVERFPTAENLRLNFGQFFLTINRWYEAEQQFTTARDLNPRNPQAYLALGLANFEQKKFEAALQHFQAAIDIDRDSFEGYLNAAICFERLKQNREADMYWEHAKRLAKTAEWRSRIESQQRAG